jgi:uncharacterized protein (TIGR02099 family)
MLQFLLRLINRLLWGAITVVLLLLAIVVSLGRYYMPQLGNYQQQLLAQVRSQVNLEFEVGSLEGEWRGLSPVVRVKNFRLLNPDGEVVIKAGHLAVYFDLLESLYHQTPLAQTVSLVNADIALAQVEGGIWGLKGISRLEGSGSAGARVAAFFEKVDLLELTHVKVDAWLPDQVRHSIDSLSLVLRHGLDLSQLTLEVSEARGQPSLRLAAEFDGWLDDPLAFRGYLSLDEFDLRVVEPFLAAWYEKLPPTLSGEVWLDWRDGHNLETRGTLITSDWQLRHLLGRELPDLAALDFDFTFTLSPDNRVGGRIQDLGFNWASVDYRFSEVQFILGASHRDLQLQVSSADIEPLVLGASNSKLLPAQLQGVFDILKPSGRLKNIYLDIPLQKDRLPEFLLRANLAGAELESWKGAPGARSIDGYVEAGLLQGYVDLDGSDLQLDFPGLYDSWLDFDGVDARVGWQVGERVLVNSGLIGMHGEFGTGSAQLDLDIPRRKLEGDYPLMSLMIGVQDSDAKYRDLFIPKILSKNLLAWLDDSIVAADVDQLGFIYYGALASKNPLDKTVQLFLDARNGRLQYQPGWPLLKNVQANVVLSDDYLIATASQATTLNSALGDVRVELTRRDNVGWLGITGDLEGPARDLIKLLNDSPLQAATGGAFEAWSARGQYSAQLDLNIPMASSLAPDLSVTGKLANVELVSKALGLTFDKLRGDISYRSATGVSAKRLRANLWGQPLVASVSSGAATASGNIPLVLRAEGELAVDGLQQWLQNPAIGLAWGKAPMQAEMTIVAAGDSTMESSLQIRSELVGIELDLPRPFGKAALHSRPTELKFNLSEAGHSELRYAGIAGGRFHIAPDTTRVGIWLGEELLPALPAAGIVVSGALPRADLTQWLDSIEHFTSLMGESSVAPQHLLTVERLKIAELRAFGQRVRNPVVDIGVLGEHWQVAIEHPRIQGNIVLPVADQAYDINLEYLRLPLDETDKVAVAADTGLAQVDPAQLPATRVKIGQFSVGDFDMGSWVFDSVPTPQGVALSGLTVSVGGAIFGGLDITEGAELHWSYDGAAHHSRLQGMLRAGNLDELFSHWGYDTGVVSESAEVIVYFNWDDTPDAIDASVITGDMYLTVRQGQLLQTSGTAADALRLLGILNINNLARRLRLDFSDVYKKGLSYDKIQGILLFDRGSLSMVEPLLVDGPSSYVKMTGDFDLNGGEIDADLVVALPFTSNLPWMVALTLPGGIPIAAGVFVAGKVFEKQLQKLTSAVYNVSGTFEDPEIEFKRMSEPVRKKSSKKDNSNSEAVMPRDDF